MGEGGIWKISTFLSILLKTKNFSKKNNFKKNP